MIEIANVIVPTLIGIGSGLIVGLAGYIKNDAKTKGAFNTLPEWRKALPIMLSCAVTGAVAGFYGITPDVATAMPMTAGIGVVVEKIYKAIMARFFP